MAVGAFSGEEEAGKGNVSRLACIILPVADTPYNICPVISCVRTERLVLGAVADNVAAFVLRASN